MSIIFFAQIISANDIASYGGLCALATMDRGELKKKVFENSEFKQFLELEPQVREVLYTFYNSKYGTCLELLTKMKVHIWKAFTNASPSINTTPVLE